MPKTVFQLRVTRLGLFNIVMALLFVFWVCGMIGYRSGLQVGLRVGAPAFFEASQEF